MQADLFAAVHAHLPYIDTVTILEHLSSPKVLTSRWIDGASPNALLKEVESLPEDSEEHDALQVRVYKVVCLNENLLVCICILNSWVLHSAPCNLSGREVTLEMALRNSTTLVLLQHHCTRWILVLAVTQRDLYDIL